MLKALPAQVLAYRDWSDEATLFGFVRNQDPLYAAYRYPRVIHPPVRKLAELKIRGGSRGGSVRTRTSVDARGRMGRSLSDPRAVIGRV